MTVSGKRVGLGITTYNRPDFLRAATSSVDKFVADDLDMKIVHDDASTEVDTGLFTDLVGFGWDVRIAPKNRGVGPAKNVLLKRMLDADCDYLILMEDDIEVISPDAVQRYVGVMVSTGIGHLNFAHHGPANQGKPVARQGDLTAWPNLIGAWSVYSREALLEAGLMDENFQNAWEHVEHTYRIIQNGRTAAWRNFADLTDSPNLLREQKGALDRSTVNDWDDPVRAPHVQEGLLHWYRTRPMPSDLMALIGR